MIKFKKKVNQIIRVISNTEGLNCLSLKMKKIGCSSVESKDQIEPSTLWFFQN